MKNKIKIIQIMHEPNTKSILGLGSDSRLWVFDYRGWHLMGDEKIRLTTAGAIRRITENKNDK